MRGDERPFERVDANLTAWRVLVSAFGFALMGPVRIVCSLVIMVGYLGILKIGLWLNAPREVVKKITRVAARALLFCLGFWWIEEFNRPKDVSCPVILVSNHVSIVEILYFMSTPFCPAFAMKATCVNVPIVGSVAIALGAILIDRSESKSGSATEALVNRIAAMKSNPDDFPPLLIFPEGTTSNGDFLLRFRKGTFVAGESVLPVVIDFPFAPGEFSVAYESVSTITFLWRLLAQHRHRMRVSYLQPYCPSNKETQDAQLFADNVRLAMQAEFQSVFKRPIFLTDQSYKDKLDYHTWLRSHYEETGALYFLVRPDLVKSTSGTKSKNI